MTMLEPDRDQLEIFVDAIFRHAGGEGFVSLRSFLESESKASFRTSSVRLNGQGFHFLVDFAEDDARRAAQAPKAVVFCPPVAIFRNKSGAKETDLLLGPVLSAELDRRPHEALDRLESVLGPATVVVRSGGQWIDDDTGEIEDKLHAHWRLAVPARGEDLAKLKRARELAARLAGGDTSNVPICHPIRWPGSWHRKAKPRMCEMVRFDPDREISLDEALTALTAAASPEAPPRGNKQDALDDDPRNLLDWDATVEKILTGREYHPALAPLSSSFAAHDVPERAAFKLLHALMLNSSPGDSEREQRRKTELSKLPGTVSSAYAKFARAPGQTPTEWPQPIDLWGKLEPPALPRNVLPRVIEDFAFSQGEMMGADPSGLAMGALTVCAAAIPDSTELRVKQYDPSWLESARIWVALFGDVSTKKTPIIQAAAKPLVRRDIELARRYAGQKKVYEIAWTRTSER